MKTEILLLVVTLAVSALLEERLLSLTLMSFALFIVKINQKI